MVFRPPGRRFLYPISYVGFRHPKSIIIAYNYRVKKIFRLRRAIITTQKIFSLAAGNNYYTNFRYLPQKAIITTQTFGTRLYTPLYTALDTPLDTPLETPFYTPLDTPLDTPLYTPLYTLLYTPLYTPLNTQLNRTLLFSIFGTPKSISVARRPMLPYEFFSSEIFGVILS